MSCLTVIEDLALELKKDYTIVIVTHNMQQAARISDKTAFFLLGELIEFAIYGRKTYVEDGNNFILLMITPH